MSENKASNYDEMKEKKILRRFRMSNMRSRDVNDLPLALTFGEESQLFSLKKSRRIFSHSLLRLLVNVFADFIMLVFWSKSNHIHKFYD